MTGDYDRGFDLSNCDEQPIPPDFMAPVLVAVRTTINLPTLAQHLGYSLESAGERYRMPCPFPSTTKGVSLSCSAEDGAKGSTPSNLYLSIGPSGWFGYCHSCRRAIDALDLHALTQSRPWMSSCRLLAQAAGVSHYLDGEAATRPGIDEVDEELAEPFAVGNGGVRSARSSASHINGKPSLVSFEQALLLNKHAQQAWATHLRATTAALEYVRGRGITDEQITRYGIGYAPKRGILTGSIKADHVIAAKALGLIETSRKDGRSFDGFRDRIIFPYLEPAAEGRPVHVSGFAARALVFPAPDPRTQKCRNSRSVAGVWEKSSALFGLYQAQAGARVSGRCGVVEGPFDVCAADRARIPAVTPYGVAFSAAHGLRVRSLAPRVTIIVDGDDAGACSVLQTTASLVEAGFSVDDITVVDPGEGLDPDEIPAEQLRALWDAPIAVADYVRQRITAEHVNDAKRRKGAVRFLACFEGAAARELAASLGCEDAEDDIAEQRDDLRDAFDNTPPQRFATALLSQPALAPLFSAKRIAAVLAPYPSASKRLASLSFGEQDFNETRAIPVAVLASAYAVGVYTAGQALAAYDLTQPPRGTPREALRAWAGKRDSLEVQLQVEQAMLRSTVQKAK